MSNCIVLSGNADTSKVRSLREAVENCAPALDSVELWITATVAQDYERRGAFEDLRAARRIATRNGAGLYFVSPALAGQVLADCT